MSTSDNLLTPEGVQLASTSADLPTPEGEGVVEKTGSLDKYQIYGQHFIKNSNTLQAGSCLVH